MIQILQNDAEVPAGIYGEYLTEKAIPHRVVQLFAGDPLPDLAATTALVILGGKMGVHDEAEVPFLRSLKICIRQAAQAGVPVFGICLGGQLLAEALGGRVTAGHRGERGIQEVTLTAAGAIDPLFAGLPPKLKVFAWHNDSFDLPGGALHLAFSAACPGQAFRIGNACGVQFHPEVDAAIVTKWSANTGEGETYLADFVAADSAWRPLWLRLFENFLRLSSLM